MNILTFDIEEWHIYRLYPKGGESYYLPILDNVLDSLLELLSEKQIKATFFCLGIIARDYPGIIRRISSQGHEIGCHSDKHIHLSHLGYKEFASDLRSAIDSLEQVCGKKILAYRAPAFSVSSENTWFYTLLAENGILYDSSVFPLNRFDGGFPDFPARGPLMINTPSGSVMEFPINYGYLFSNKIAFSGGGYFRLIPYLIIRNMMKSSNYVMTYFHLRDFDVKQKRVISLNYFKSYYGVSRMFPKLRKLLEDYPFETISSFVTQIDTQSLPVLKF